MRFPGSGKSCNKRNTSGTKAPGYSATCSLFGRPPGLRMTGRQVRAICFGRLDCATAVVSGSALRVLNRQAARAGRKAAEGLPAASMRTSRLPGRMLQRVAPVVFARYMFSGAGRPAQLAGSFGLTVDREH
jgi:hypothetical protein